MKNVQRGSVLVIIGLVLAALVAVGGIYYYYVSTTSKAPLVEQQVPQQQVTAPTVPANPEQANVPVINNSQDLGSASASLDNTDLNQLDSDLAL